VFQELITSLGNVSQNYPVVSPELIHNFIILKFVNKV
jgi:hypothetical protein